MILLGGFCSSTDQTPDLPKIEALGRPGRNGGFRDRERIIMIDCIEGG